MRCCRRFRVRGNKIAMPFASKTFARLTASIVALAASGLIALSCGCRALHCKTSDEGITAARALSLRGMDAQQQGHWDQAEALYAAAVEKCPTDERARCGYADSLWQRGAQVEAIAHMEHAVRLSGDDPVRQIQLGRMYLARGELNRALSAAGKAIASNKQFAPAWALQGDVLRAEGDRGDALASYHRALAYQDHYPEVQLAVSEIYSQQNRPERALATLQTLADRYPPGQIPSDVLYREGLVLRDLGRFRDAAISIARATERGQPSADMLYELSRTQLLAGDATAARLACLAALSANPQHAPSQGLKAELDGQQHQMAAVVEPHELR